LIAVALPLPSTIPSYSDFSGFMLAAATFLAMPYTFRSGGHIKVSLVTTHRALQELESAGLLDCKQGRGTYVADRSAADARRVRIGLCEAVVQRMPEYLDTTLDENHTAQADLQSETNLRFGRKFRIISFRWLNSNEI